MLCPMMNDWSVFNIAVCVFYQNVVELFLVIKRKTLESLQKWETMLFFLNN